jgi:hypothetical protein
VKEETFNLVIDKLQKAYKLESELSELGLSIVELNEGYHIAIKALLLELFSPDKIDVIDWYLYEYRKGKMIISDSKTKKVLYDLDKKGDLWKYLNE